MPRFHVTYEATGFTNDPSILDATCSPMAAEGFTEVAQREGTLPQGVLGVVEGYIAPDDDQGDTDIRVFASVTLLIDARSAQAAERMPPPEGILTRVADMMGTTEDGSVALELEAHSWQAVDCGAAPEASLRAASRSASGMRL